MKAPVIMESEFFIGLWAIDGKAWGRCARLLDMPAARIAAGWVGGVALRPEVEELRRIVEARVGSQGGRR